jgi:dienelactone hydrolase
VSHLVGRAIRVISAVHAATGGDVRYSAGMTTVLLFHHARGQTAGFLAFADELREAGHTVQTPDLYDGNTFGDLDEGVGYAKQVGFDEILRSGSATADELPADIVYAGFSLGVMPAQCLAQTRPGARGAILYSAAMPTSEFGGPWPEGVPLQIHMMDRDPWAEEDLPAAEALVEEIEDAELFLYPGSEHLFADSSLDDYDEQAAGLLMERTLTFLHRVG